MAIALYELTGADPELRFSPYCWRARMALAHKDLTIRGIPWRFSEKAALPPAAQGRVPVLKDGNRVVADSWGIASYLEERYDDRPSLFGGDMSMAHARFINAWTDLVVHPGISRLIIRDVLDVLDPKDRAYFRKSREERYGMKLEQVQAGREEHVAEFRASLVPMRTAMAAEDWVGGPDGPSYADYILFGAFMWARCTSRFELLAEDDPLTAWRERMLDLFGGLARSAKTVG
ncbi:MAG: glutathione S-transferase family protein [Acetobacteraceae bacterium]